LTDINEQEADFHRLFNDNKGSTGTVTSDTGASTNKHTSSTDAPLASQSSFMMGTPLLHGGRGGGASSASSIHSSPVVQHTHSHHHHHWYPTSNDRTSQSVPAGHATGHYPQASSSIATPSSKVVTPRNSNIMMAPTATSSYGSGRAAPMSAPQPSTTRSPERKAVAPSALPASTMTITPSDGEREWRAWLEDYKKRKANSSASSLGSGIGVAPSYVEGATTRAPSSFSSSVLSSQVQPAVSQGRPLSSVASATSTRPSSTVLPMPSFGPISPAPVVVEVAPSSSLSTYGGVSTTAPDQRAATAAAAAAAAAAVAVEAALAGERAANAVTPLVGVEYPPVSPSLRPQTLPSTLPQVQVQAQAQARPSVRPSSIPPANVAQLSFEPMSPFINPPLSANAAASSRPWNMAASGAATTTVPLDPTSRPFSAAPQPQAQPYGVPFSGVGGGGGMEYDQSRLPPTLPPDLQAILDDPVAYRASYRPSHPVGAAPATTTSAMPSSMSYTIPPSSIVITPAAAATQQPLAASSVITSRPSNNDNDNEAKLRVIREIELPFTRQVQTPIKVQRVRHSFQIRFLRFDLIYQMM
jgi:hypothetical protein